MVAPGFFLGAMNVEGDDEEDGDEGRRAVHNLGFAQATSPTWRSKDVVGGHDHLWGHEPLVVRQGEITLHKEQRP